MLRFIATNFVEGFGNFLTQTTHQFLIDRREKLAGAKQDL